MDFKKSNTPVTTVTRDMIELSQKPSASSLNAPTRSRLR